MNPYHDPKVQLAIRAVMWPRRCSIHEGTRGDLRALLITRYAEATPVDTVARGLEILLASLRMNENMRKDLMAALIKERERMSRKPEKKKRSKSTADPTQTDAM